MGLADEAFSSQKQFI